MKGKKKSAKLKSILVGLAMFVVCATFGRGVGLFFGQYLGKNDFSTTQMIIHLVFGLITGYTFSSFRIGSFNWYYDGEKVRFSKVHL